MTAVLIIVGIFILTIIGTYNSLIAKRNNVTNAFSSVDVILKKRFDLIPNLVATVQAYAKHEQDTFTKVAALRSGDYSQMSIDDKVAMANEMNRAQNLFRMVSERYPDLKASQNFLELQASLNETEEQLSAARRAFNSSVTIYNTALQSFPSNLIASMFHFTAKSVLEITEEERQNPDVKKLFQ